MKSLLILFTNIIMLSSFGQGSPFGPKKVFIGTQVWMAQNLNVDTYRNGDIIPQVTDASKWSSLTTGAWCYYNNDPANGPIYGKLYNWYAVNDPRGLAPKGWHIPSDAEWRKLFTELGGLSLASGKMKSTENTRWTNRNSDATNESGFAGLPGGVRYWASANFSMFDSYFGAHGYWWSASKNKSDIYAFTLTSRSSSFKGNSSMKNGMSVRCVRD